MSESIDRHKVGSRARGGTHTADAPRPVLSFVDAVALTVGIVIGAGIFRTPSFVAANAGSESTVLLAWVLGGAVSLVGAAVYAELATAYPSAGGDYYYLTRAYGARLAFLFAWARMTIIQTGSIALLAFVFGDYADEIFPLGDYSPAIYAALIVVALTGLNILGMRQGTRTQNLLTGIEVLGVLLVIVAGLLVSPTPTPVTAAEAPATSGGSFGLAMVFVLLTYGGWNEAVYVSAELRNARKQMARVLIASILLLTTLYVLINLAYLRALGAAGVAGSEAVASDVMRNSFGARGAWLISLLVAVSALTSANATIITGARTNYALGRDFPAFEFLGRWSGRGATPTNALIVQGMIALLLIGFGAWTREGFGSIVEYTAPVFWFFFLLVGIALFVLRRKDKDVPREFKVPLYPFLPLVFCFTSAYLLYSSLAYTGKGAAVGVAVLGAGALLLLIVRPRDLVPNAQSSPGG